MTHSKINVDKNSLNQMPAPFLGLVEVCKMLKPKIKCVVQTPAIAPLNCAAKYINNDCRLIAPARQNIKLTAGLKCAPEIGPSKVISTYNPQPVAMLLPNKATAALPAPNVSPIMPEPVTIANKSAVPMNSAAILFFIA